MLVFTTNSAQELAQSLIDACDSLDKNTSLECITIVKMSGLFVCTEDSVLTQDTWVAITRDKITS